MQKIVADFHFHSKFSRATSQEMVLANLVKWAGLKGINLLGTADFTHPFWFSALKRDLEDLGTGLYKLKGQSDEIKFILSTEISSIYSEGGQVRKIHTLVMMPSLAAAEKLNDRLSSIGNLYSDGRPILGLPAYDLTRICLEVDRKALVVPAHIWTPYFSVFGSKSGYDSLQECFRDLTPHILAYETGLSSDPAMNWRVSELDNLALISNGDSHSLGNIAREANVFLVPAGQVLSYDLIFQMLREGSPKARESLVASSSQALDAPRDKPHLAYTIEFYPEEGKYHWSGHRNCGYKTDHSDNSGNSGATPGQTPGQGSSFLCPKCGRPLTLGVMYRVNQLADRPLGSQPVNPVPYKSLVQLSQIIAQAKGVGENTQTVQALYEPMVKKWGSELKILEEVSLTELAQQTESKIVEGIKRVRAGKIEIDPGYDGEYGQVKIFGGSESGSASPQPQASLF